MKIIFMGTPEFAVPSLQNLIDSIHDVVAVFTAPPKPKGRGMNVEKSPIHILAQDNNIPVYTPTTLRNDEVHNLISELDADIIIVVAYGFIIPKSIIDSKKYGCLNIHPSKLPRFRGAAPLQRTIISGDMDTAICIMQMDEGLDTGDIILQEDILLQKDITYLKLHDICAKKGADLLLKVLDNIESLPRIKQSGEGIVYASKLTKEEGKLNWNDSVIYIDRQIRGMNPWPGTYCNYNGSTIKILDAKAYITDVEGLQPGTILHEKSMVVCKDGMLEIFNIKKSGSGKMTFRELLCGEHTKILFMDS